MAYGYSRGDGKILVFDLGGGTLDVSIVDFGSNVCEVICTEGEDRLGGDDFDEVIMSYVLEEAGGKSNVTMELDPVRRLMLKEVAEQAKITLSTVETATIRIPGFFNEGETARSLDIPIGRKQFEEMAQPLFDKAARLLSKALESARIRGPELDAVLLLGGSSRIPHIRTFVERTLGRASFTGVDPETCVAQGAAIVGAILDGKREVRDTLILDVIASSYGTATLGGVCTKIIDKNTTVPTSGMKSFTTTEDNQATITVAVYQGEREFARDHIPRNS